MGAVGVKRGVNLEALDPDEPETIAETFGIAHQLVREVEHENDEGGPYTGEETPEERWARIRAWATSKLKAET